MITTWFLGTPEAAIPSLRSLASISEVRLVVTRPDRPQGRNRRVTSPPVKVAADELGIEVLQPESGTDLARAVQHRPAPDVGVVVAFGMILRPPILAIPRGGFLNVHFSLLPRWRGAAPVQRAVMAGDTETGVTVMAMDAGLDTGPVVDVRRTAIHPSETGGELTQRLAGMGAELLAATLGPWFDGRLTASPQQEEQATYASRLEAADRILGPTLTLTEAIDRVRALAPEPGAQVDVTGRPHRVLALAPGEIDLPPGRWGDSDGHPHLGFADGAARIVTIQPPGKRPLAGADWLRGRPLLEG